MPDKSKEGDKENEVRHYFATNYFDSLTVTKKSLDISLVGIMDMESKESESNRADDMERNTSVQSYTMYFSSNMWKKYEKDYNKDLEKADDMDNARRGNPFEENKNLRYLSIIQVHITPEILRRAIYDESELWNEGGIILEPFINDLYDVVEKVGQSCLNDNFVYRIYQILSAGDLAVVVQSRFPGTSYRVSSGIRQRVAEEKQAF